MSVTCFGKLLSRRGIYVLQTCSILDLLASLRTDFLLAGAFPPLRSFRLAWEAAVAAKEPEVRLHTAAALPPVTEIPTFHGLTWSGPGSSC